MKRGMESLSIKIYWILVSIYFVEANYFQSANENVKKPTKNPRPAGAPIWSSPRPLATNGQAPIARQPPGSFPPMPNTGGFAPWQSPVPFPQNGPLGPPNFQTMGNRSPLGPGGWPPQQAAPQMPPPGGYGQGGFWPQPSQWPFVDTVGQPLPPPSGNTGPFRWGQGPPPINPGAGGPPWQGPPPPQPAIYSQWLPSTLGSVAVPPSPPWSAPGTMYGGPQLSPQGPWSAQPQPFAHNPPTVSNHGHGHRPSHSPASMPSYIRTGYDASANAAATQSTRNANPFSRVSQNPHQPRFVVPEIQQPILEPTYVVENGNYPIPIQIPYHVPSQENLNYQQQSYMENENLDLAIPQVIASNGAILDYIASQAYQPSSTSIHDTENNQPALIRGRDNQNFGTSPSEGSREYENGGYQIEDQSQTTQSSAPTPTPTDDPYAMNPNIIFGGPASLVFPELTIQGTSGLIENNGSGPPLSVHSIRIGDILSFPQGTQFGAVPPPNPAKKMIFNSRAQSLPEDFVGLTSDINKIDKINNALLEGQDRMFIPKSINPIAVVTPAPTTVTTDPISIEHSGNNRIGIGRPYKGVKHVQNLGKNSGSTLTDTILEQIQELKVVLYGRANCSVCLETEGLLKNYSIPVYYLELDTTAREEQMLTIVQQMTHSLEMPLTFICGRFVGGYQRLHDLHVNQQIAPLLRECLPSKRRLANSMTTKRLDRN